MALILVIDDEDLLRRVLVDALKSAGHQIIEASSGKDAVTLIRTHAPDLVLTDIVMPDRDGLELLTALRKEQPNVPVIAMSGKVVQSGLYLNVAGKLGARAVLAKPFRLDELFETVNRVLADAKSKGPSS